MKLLAALLTVLVGSQSMATVSSYYIGTFEDGGVSGRFCSGVDYEDESGTVYTCETSPSAEGLGYGQGYIGGDHAMIVTFSYKGQEVPYEVLWKNFRQSSGASHEYWPKNGVMEWRYQVVAGKKVPFSVIFRMATAILGLDEDGTLVLLGVDEELIVIKLDGANTTAIGKINGKLPGANLKARKLADSLL